DLRSMIRLFSLTLPVSRRFYAIWGFVLMIAKYGIDAAIVYSFTGQIWSPLDYLNPVLVMREHSLEHGPSWLLFALGAWTLPFMWIGVTMSIRRAVDAGYKGWLGFLFFIPIINYMMMIFLGAAATLPFALEGIVCLALPFPLAAVMLILGPLLGRAIATGKHRGGPPPAALTMVLVALPFLTGAEAATERAPLREVLSTI